MRANTFLSSDDDSPLPAMRPRGRLAASALARIDDTAPAPSCLASIDHASANGRAQAPTVLTRRVKPSKADLLARARAVDRTAAALNRPPSTTRFLLPVSATKAARQSAIPPLAPERPPEASATTRNTPESTGCAIDISSHLCGLAHIATPPPGCSEEHIASLSAALEAAVGSLTTASQQQSRALEESVVTLKASFRDRLAALEAEFVRRAEAMSAELAAAVAEQKRAADAAVAEHATQLAGAIDTVSSAQRGVRQSGVPWSHGGAYATPAPRGRKWAPESREADDEDDEDDEDDDSDQGDQGGVMAAAGHDDGCHWEEQEEGGEEEVEELEVLVPSHVPGRVARAVAAWYSDSDA